MPRLTASLVTRLTPTDREYTCWDETIPGFGLRVWPSGRKVYVVKYRVRGQRQTKRSTLGTTQVLDPAQARVMAQEVVSLVRSGRDPALGTHPERRTVHELAERYMAEHATPKKRPSSARMDAVNLRLHVLPALGKQPVSTVTRQHIQQLHHRMQGTPGAANRVLSLLSKMFSLAEQWGLREMGSNPARGLQRYRERKIERFLSAEELLRLGQALAEAEYLRTVSPSVIACIRLLLFTGARLGEILGLRWAWIDMERGVARLPESKTGAKTLRLPAPALAVLRSLPRTSGYVLPGRKPGRPLSNPHWPWRRLCEAAEIEQCRIHDLRHTYASWGAMDGLSLPMIGALLGHQSHSTTARYSHLVGDPVALAGEQVAARVRQAMGEG